MSLLIYIYTSELYKKYQTKWNLQTKFYSVILFQFSEPPFCNHLASTVGHHVSK